MGSLLFKHSETAAWVVCYSNTEKQQHGQFVIQTQRNNSTGCVLFKHRETAAWVVCYSNTVKQQHG